MNIVPFAYGMEVVRTAGTPDAPLFAGKDVCQCLGIQNYNDALRSLEGDEKGVGITDPLSTEPGNRLAEKVSVVIDTPGGPQQMTFVTEPGLFRLIFKSRKEEAVKFQKWVCGEVLPALRRTGSYALAPLNPPAMPALREVIQAPEFILQEWTDECIRDFIPASGRTRAQVKALLVARNKVQVSLADIMIDAACAMGRIIEDFEERRIMLHRGKSLATM